MLKNRLVHLAIFTVSFACLATFLDMPRIMNFAPISAHMWRQSDGASIAMNYATDGLDFFKPRIHNLTHHDDPHTVGEFPATYYIAAVFYKIFGQHDFILRGLHLLVFAIGLFALYRIAWHLTADLVTSLAISLLFIASPILGFYAPNFLPNTPALGCVFVAWWCFYHYIADGRRLRWFVACNVAFMAAGLLKPTSLISWVAVAVLFFFEILRGTRWTMFGVRRTFGGNVFEKRNQKEGEFSKQNVLKDKTRQDLLASLSLLIVVVPMVAWRLWAAHYNQMHQTEEYFLAQTMPIWGIEAKTRADIFNWFFLFYKFQLFEELTHFILVGLLIFSAVTYRRQPKLAFWFTVLVGLGVAAHVVLWYQQLMVHDYYSIDWFVLPAATLVLFAFYLKKQDVFDRNGKWLARAAFVSLLFLNAEHARRYLAAERYNPKFPNIGMPEFYGQNPARLRTFLRSAGVRTTDTIISLPDGSPNTSLYYYDCRGYTAWNLGDKISLEWLMCWVKNNHASHLVVSNWQSPMLDSLRDKLPPPTAALDSTFLVFDLQQLQADCNKTKH